MKDGHSIGWIAAAGVASFAGITIMSVAYRMATGNQSGLADAVSASANVVMAGAALYAARAWKRQLIFNQKAELANRIRDCARRLRNSIQDSSSKSIPVVANIFYIANLIKNEMQVGTPIVQELEALAEEASIIISMETGRKLLDLCDVHKNTLHLARRIGLFKDVDDGLLYIKEEADELYEFVNSVYSPEAITQKTFAAIIEDLKQNLR